MAKKQSDTLSDLKTRLDTLNVKRCVSKTKEHDKEILTLSEKIDYIEFGIKK